MVIGLLGKQRPGITARGGSIPPSPVTNAHLCQLVEQTASNSVGSRSESGGWHYNTMESIQAALGLVLKTGVRLTTGGSTPLLSANALVR